MSATTFLFIFLLFNAVLLFFLVFKLKGMRWYKKIGVFFFGFFFSAITVYWATDRLALPLDFQVEEFVLFYEKEAENVRTVSIVEDKTKSDSYIVVAGFSRGDQNCFITMPISRGVTFDSGWYVHEASVNCK